MKFLSTNIADVFVIEIEKHTDERGFFARTFCVDEFKNQGIEFIPVQSNISFNSLKGTLRGLHLQSPAAPEAKLLRCTKGKIYDVVVDLRPKSSTFKQWFGTEMTANEYNAIYIPPGCAQGFLTLENNCELLYYMNGKFSPQNALGYRWNDPAFNIKWPAKPVLLSKQDQQWPEFTYE